MPQKLVDIAKQGYINSNELNLLSLNRMRPFINKRGQSVYQNGAQQVPVQNGLLRKYEWEEIDAAVLDVHRQPIMGITELLAAGLVHPLGGLGVSISTYEQLSDMTPAGISMSVTPSRGEGDRVDFGSVSVPVPIISKPFQLDLRTLDASRRMSEALDVTQVRVATRKVREAMEEMFFNGSTLKFSEFSIYGITNQPVVVSENTDTATNFGGGDFGTDGNGHATLVGMIDLLAKRGFNGPFGAYVSPNQYKELLALTGANLSETQLSVILRTIPELQFVKRAPKLTDGVTAMVQFTADVLDLAVGMDLTAISWQEWGGMLTDYRVMTASVPRVKFDSENQAGIAIATSC